MSDEDNKTDQADNDKSLNAANAAVFHKVRKFGKLQLVALAVIAAVLAAVGIAVYSQTLPALKVGKYSYSRDEYKVLVDQAAKIKVNETDARKALTKALASKEAADRLKVSYASDAVSLNEAAGYEYKVTSDDVSRLSDYQRETSVYRIVEANIRFETKGGYKASVVYLPFARYIYGFELNSKTAQSANFDLIGNERAVARDMAYAYKKGEELRQAYISKSKTVEQIVQAAQDDQVLGYGQEGRPSSRLLVTGSNSIETYAGKDVSLSLHEAQFRALEENKNKLGKPSELIEELASPQGVPAMPQLLRGDQIVVSYYFVIVDSVVQPKAETQTEYEKLVKELSNA